MLFAACRVSFQFSQPRSNKNKICCGQACHPNDPNSARPGRCRRYDRVGTNDRYTEPRKCGYTASSHIDPIARCEVPHQVCTKCCRIEEERIIPCAPHQVVVTKPANQRIVAAKAVKKVADTATEAKRPWCERKTEYIDHIGRAPRSVLLVSCADKLHNVRSILAGANLAQCLALLEDDARTEAEFKATTDAALRALGPSSRITLANDANYAAFLTEHGRYAEAVVVLERAAPLIERELGRSHPQCLAARTTLARARMGMSQPARALAELADAESLSRPGQQLPRIERRAVEIALEAAKASGDDALSSRLERILAGKADR